jgi:hypothetical protein
MKTTIEIPDAIFRRAETKTAGQGIPLRQLISRAVEQSLEAKPSAKQHPWAALSGRLQYLRKETARINALIEQQFEQSRPRNGRNSRYECAFRSCRRG